MKFRSNMEAARRFMNDEGIVNEPVSFNRLVYCFRSLRSRWARLSKRQKSESTKKSFMEFQQEWFIKPDVTNEPTVAQSSDDDAHIKKSRLCQAVAFYLRITY